MSITAPEALFNGRQGDIAHYLSELNRESDQWQSGLREMEA